MSIANSSKSVTNGLVFHMDTSNIKSYIGPPIKNVLNQITPRGISDNGSSYRVFSGTENVYIPTLGTVNNCAYVDSYNNYPTSGNCCPTFYGYGDGLTVSGGTQYTYAILYNCFTGYNNANYMYHYEYGTSGYITEFGVYYPAGNAYGCQNVVMGNSNWNWGSAIFTTNAGTTYLNTGSWYYQYSIWDRLYVAKILLTPGDFRNMHPKYWPAVGTTRTNTQCLIDLTGNNTITANSLTYNSNGSFSFGGSDYCTVGSIPGSFSSFTVSVWFNSTSVSNYRNPIDCNYSSYPGVTGNVGPRLEQNSSGNLVWVVSGNSTNNSVADAFTVQSSGLSANTWYNAVITWTNGNANTYLNGVPVTVGASTPSGFVGTFGSVVIGKGFSLGGTERSFVGQVPNVQIYNRALSASEVLQNFNAIRGVYGI